MKVIAKFLPVLALFFLFPAASSESLSGAGGALYSEWSATPAAAEVLPVPVPVRYGSFTVSRPQSELFIGGLAARWRAELSGLASAEQFEEFALRRFRAEITSDGGSADIGDWLAARGAASRARLLTGSADYLTSYLTGLAEQGAGGLSFVRNVELDYQSALGERRWSSGLSALGALREGDDDAVVWQMRAFAAEESSKGANAGLIYRRVAGIGLIGVNTFLDYEKNGDYDEDFWRWSLGGEYRSGIVNVYLNRYLAITDGVRSNNDGRWIYTQDGTDAELDIQIAHLPLGGFSGGATYYRWEGEYGDEDDKGFRYYLQLQPAVLGSRLRLRLELDSPDVGSVDWGGAASYSYLLNAPEPAAAAAAESGFFDPRAHFFDPVRREYSQRIVRSVFGGGINYEWVAGTAYLSPLSPVGADVAIVTLIAAADGRNFLRPHRITAATKAASTLRVATRTAGQGWTVSVHQLGKVVFTAEERTNISIVAGTVTVQQFGSDIGTVRLTTAEIALLSAALEMGLNSEGDEIFIELEEGGVDAVVPYDISVRAAHAGKTVTVAADSLGGVKAKIRIINGTITVISDPLPIDTDSIRPRIVLVGGSPEATFAKNVWSSTGAGESLTLAGPDSFPISVRSAALAALGGTLYLSGGHTANSAYSNAVYRSVDGGASWVSVGVFADTARFLHSMVSYNDKLYIIGGLPSTFRPTGEVLSSSDGVTWTEAGTITAGYGRAAVVHNNTLFIIGGVTFSGSNVRYFTDSFAIDKDGTIHTLTVSNNLPAYYNAAAVSFKGTIYRIGGEDFDRNPQNEIWSSADGENWTRLMKKDEDNQDVPANFPVNIESHQALVFGEGIYVLGGRRDSSMTYDRVWYSTNAKDWEELSNMPDARYLHAAIVYPHPSPISHNLNLRQGGKGQGVKEQGARGRASRSKAARGRASRSRASRGRAELPVTLRLNAGSR